LPRINEILHETSTGFLLPNPTLSMKAKQGLQMPDAVPKVASDGATQSPFAIHKHWQRLHAWLVRRLRDPDAADDLAQEIFLRLHRTEKTALIRKPLAYLYGIAFHVISEHQTAKARSRIVYDSDEVDRADESLHYAVPDQTLERLNLQQQLQSALDELPETHRAVVLLCKRDGMSYEEAAAVLGLSVHTVEKYLVRARAILSAQAWDR
jgi:RNA polymerase sigma-19 factor, ECF subfamily